MKRLIIFWLSILCFCIVTADIISQEQNIWDVVKETSWRYEDNWTGGIVTFYETDNGDKMAVWQMCGSGVMVTGSFLFRIHIENNELLFFHHTAVMKEQEPAYIYFFDEESKMLYPRKGFNVLFFFSSEPWIANKFESIPIEELKREDYSRLDLIN